MGTADHLMLLRLFTYLTTGDPLNLPLVEVDNVEDFVIIGIVFPRRSFPDLLEDGVASSSSSTLFLLDLHQSPFYFLRVQMS